MTKFDAGYVEGLPIKPAGYVAYDPKLSGFGVRVAAGGTRSFIVEFRPGGGGRKVPTKRMTIGRVGVMTLAQARDRARRILAEVRVGIDPAAAKADRREAPTVAELSRLYLEQEVRPFKKPRTTKLYEDYFRIHVVPAFGTRKARDITRADVAKLHRKIGETARPTANYVAALMGGMYSWAVKVGEVPEDFNNPARGISRFKINSRERFLSVDELARLGDALREAETIGLHDKDGIRRIMSPHVVAAVGCCCSRVAESARSWICDTESVDLDRGVLALPDSKTGQKIVALPAPAMEVLATLPRLGAYVIAGADPDRPRSDLNQPWRAITERANLVGVSRHDLRHLFASVGVAGNLGLPVIGRSSRSSQVRDDSEICAFRR